jgi:hypothetical protein
MTPMGPTSPPIYRPSPQPQYPGSSPQQALWLYLLNVSFYCISTYLHQLKFN